MKSVMTKNILAAAVAGILLSTSGAAMAEGESSIRKIDGTNYQINFYDNDRIASIVDVSDKNNPEQVIGSINTSTGSTMAFNMNEFKKGIQGVNNPQIYLESISYPVDFSALKLENLKTGKIDKNVIDEIKSTKEKVSEIVTSDTKDAYVSAVRNGGNSAAFLELAKAGPELAKEYARVINEQSFALDSAGRITVDDSEGTGERYSVKNVVAGLNADTTIYVNEDGSYTMDSGAGNTVRVNDAVVDLDSRTRSNTQAIAANTRTLQEHSARLHDQQRQINENHKEMKRAAAQSAALAGLFQPYSVGKFNATAALGGYSDQQAVAVGVGYRFNANTAAKAGVAFSDGAASYNMGVNFEF